MQATAQTQKRTPNVYLSHSRSDNPTEWVIAARRQLNQRFSNYSRGIFPVHFGLCRTGKLQTQHNCLPSHSPDQPNAGQVVALLIAHFNRNQVRTRGKWWCEWFCSPCIRFVWDRTTWVVARVDIESRCFATQWMETLCNVRYPAHYARFDSLPKCRQWFVEADIKSGHRSWNKTGTILVMILKKTSSHPLKFDVAPFNRCAEQHSTFVVPFGV